MLTHRNLIANALHMLTLGHLTADERWLVIAPLFHAAGLGRRARHGVERRATTSCCRPSIRRRRSTSSSAHGVTATLVVPTMLAAMADEQRDRPRDVSIAAAHRPRRLADRHRDVAPRRTPRSPAPSSCTSTARPRPRRSPRRCPHEERVARHATGPLVRPAGGRCRRRACVDADGPPCRTGEVGEIVIRGRERDAGLLEQARGRRPRRSATAGTAPATSATRTRTAFIFLVDRAKDMIITGGENVYSTEVEEVLYRHPAVLEAAVFGVPDEHWGEAVHAVVVARAAVDGGGAARALPATASPATRFRSGSSCARSRCRSRAPARSSSASSANRIGKGAPCASAEHGRRIPRQGRLTRWTSAGSGPCQPSA